MKPKQTIERLEQLIRVVEEAPKLYMRNYWQGECGTAYCAAAWAAQDAWFRRRGLHAYEDYAPIFYRGTCGLSALALFFDISTIQTDFIFCPGGKLTKRILIFRIKKVIREIEKENSKCTT